MSEEKKKASISYVRDGESGATVNIVESYSPYNALRQVAKFNAKQSNPEITKTPKQSPTNRLTIVHECNVYTDEILDPLSKYSDTMSMLFLPGTKAQEYGQTKHRAGLIIYNNYKENDPNNEREDVVKFEVEDSNIVYNFNIEAFAKTSA